ncbi:MAG TPA: TolC family protein, partial [Polyangiaceae bacterium]
LLSWALPAHAQVTSLRDLEAKALEARAGVHSRRARELASRAEVALARAGYMPTIALGADVTASPGARLVEVVSEDGTYYVQGAKKFDEQKAEFPAIRYGIGLNIKGRLYDFGRTNSAVRAARARMSANMAETDVVRASIVAEVRAAYFQWMVRSAAHTASLRALADAGQRRELVEGRIKDGVRPPSDLVSVRRFEAAARLEEAALRAARDGARDELALAVGAPLAPRAEPDFSLLDRAPQRAAKTSEAEVDALSKKRQAALATARAHEHVWYPILSAEGQAGVRGQDDQLFPAYQVGVNLTVPIWDGGAESARAEMARAEAMALQHQSKQTQYAISARRRSLQRVYRSTAERVQLAEQVRSLVAEELRNAEERYTLGRGAIEAVLDARGALTRADSDLLITRLGRAEAAMNLEAEGQN